MCAEAAQLELDDIVGEAEGRCAIVTTEKTASQIGLDVVEGETTTAPANSAVGKQLKLAAMGPTQTHSGE